MPNSTPPPPPPRPPPPRPPPRRASPPKNSPAAAAKHRPTPPAAKPLDKNVPSSPADHNDINPNRARKSPQHNNNNDYSPSTPLRHHHHNHTNGLLESPIASSRMESSPLRAAANLIQSLDIAHTEMTTYAANAAADAENARRNARTAQEIARRYSSKSYPTFSVDDPLEAFSLAGGYALARNSPSPARTATSSSFLITTASLSLSPRPNHPEITNGFRNHHRAPPSNDEDDEKKDFEAEDDPLHENGAKKSENDTNEETPRGDLPPRSPTPLYADPPKNSTGQDKHTKAKSTPTSYERIARHHADDVLQLTLELERTKQQLRSEQRSHKECQSSLVSVQKKTALLESANQKLKQEIETEKTQSISRISELEKELEVSNMKLQAAEDDAQLALDLAKDSAEQKDEMEDSLRMAQNELEQLKQQQQQERQLAVVETPTKHVHFADRKEPAEETIAPIALPSPRPNRAMVAAGRQILLRRSMSPRETVAKMELTPVKSAERRQLLAQRMKDSLNESMTTDDASIARLSLSPSRTPQSPIPAASGDTAPSTMVAANTTMKQRLEEYNTALKTLQISGKRLDLDGYWWRDHHQKTMPSSNAIQIDIIARQYCQNVEFKIGRQQKDIEQLESLCEYLEKKLVLDDGEPAAAN